MKRLLILIALIGITSAKYYPNALFADVSGVASNDTLSVRVKPNWRSRKITELPPNAYVGVDECVKTGRSTWCRVHAVNRNLGQYLEYNDKLPGWVNARYLKFSSRGYVAVNGKKNSCDYAIGCKNGKCRVVIDEIMKNGEVTAIKSKTYPRSVLTGIGEIDISFDYDSEDATEGYPCGRLSFKINDYLSKHTSSFSSAKSAAKGFLKALQSQNLSKIKSFIHPKYGIYITGDIHFAGYNIKFSRKRFAKFYNSPKEFVWGSDYGKGDPIKMSLRKMMHLKLPLNRVSKITPLPKLKYFKAIKGYTLKGFEFFWNGTGKAPEFNWRGADVIMAKINGKWYAVGFLWNRWTI